MDLFQTVVLALIQGLTEFLPISSSAHLILPAQILAWPDQGLAFDVAVHVGTLLAVMIYFRQDIYHLCYSWISAMGGLRAVDDQHRSEVLLGWQIIVATIPAVLAALLFGDLIEAQLRSTAVIATTTIIFGLLLGIAEWRTRASEHEVHGLDKVLKITWPIVIAIGLAQALALVPGTSRSGITITAAVLLGLSRTDAARFSFLLSIPIILAAGLYAALKVFSEPQVFDWINLTTAMFVAGVSAWCCIALFIKFIERVGLMPFVWYRLILGVVLFAYFV